MLAINHVFRTIAKKAQALLSFFFSFFFTALGAEVKHRYAGRTAPHITVSVLNAVAHRFRRIQAKIPSIGARLIVLGVCTFFGFAMSQAWTQVAAIDSSASDIAVNIKSDSKIEGTVDPVPPRFELGQQLYLETCATCHVAVPPAVLPHQTWIALLDDTQHYGVQIPPVLDPSRLIIWQYLEQFSRSLKEEERVPYRIRNSRYFKILHPRVEFTDTVRLSSCVQCHPSAPDFNYRRLAPEWQDAP
jgi:hypothetical protein